MSEPALSAGEATETIEAAIGRLALFGYAVADGLLPPGLAERLAERLKFLVAAGALVASGVVRDGGRRADRSIRRADICWLDGEDPAERELLDFAEALRLAINLELFLGLFHFECHFIAYPVGGFYHRHLDSLTGERNRVVSFVVYLDPDWQKEDGGALRIWTSLDEAAPPEREVQPQAGRIVLMLSETIPHEVLPATRPRHAIAGWWRVTPV